MHCTENKTELAQSASPGTSSLLQRDPLILRSPARCEIRAGCTHFTIFRQGLDEGGIQDCIPVKATLLHVLKGLQRLAILGIEVLGI